MKKTELKPSQRLVYLFKLLQDGAIINLAEYASEMGITRQAVQCQIDSLSEMGEPIVRVSNGRWGMQNGERYGWIEEN